MTDTQFFEHIVQQLTVCSQADRSFAELFAAGTKSGLHTREQLQDRLLSTLERHFTTYRQDLVNLAGYVQTFAAKLAPSALPEIGRFQACHEEGFANLLLYALWAPNPCADGTYLAAIMDFMSERWKCEARHRLLYLLQLKGSKWDGPAVSLTPSSTPNQPAPSAQPIFHVTIPVSLTQRVIDSKFQRNENGELEGEVVEKSTAKRGDDGVWQVERRYIICGTESGVSGTPVVTQQN